MVDEFKKRKTTAHMILKRLKACRFNMEVFKKKFGLSTYEKECYNSVYGYAFGKF